MHKILRQILDKRGIKDTTELSKEEREQFQTWQNTLNKDDLEVNDIKVFCEAQIKRIEVQFKDIDTPKEKLERLVLQHSIYKTLLGVIDGPKGEREALEQYLTSLV